MSPTLGQGKGGMAGVVVTAVQLDCRTGVHTSAAWHLTPGYEHCITLPLGQVERPVKVPNSSSNGGK